MPLTAQTTGMGERPQAADQRIVMAVDQQAEIGGFAGLRRVDIGEVLAGTKTAAGAGDEDRAAGLVGFRLVERIGECAVQLRRDRVEPRWAVEVEDVVVRTCFDEHGLFGHGRFL
jgi:hypothetical protein